MLVRSARKSKRPYMVTEMSKEDFVDNMTIAAKAKNFKLDDKKKTVNWMKLRNLSVRHDDSNDLLQGQSQ